MHRLVALVGLFLAACGGGSGSQPFTPSENLAESHPWLSGLWTGTMTVAGIESPASLDFDVPLPAASLAQPLLVCSPAPISPMRVAFQAGGDRARWTTTFPLGPSGPSYVWITFRAEIVLEAQSIMRLTWSREHNTELAGTVTTGTTSGSGVLTRAAGSAAESILIVETYDLPELLLHVVTMRRR
jgi:hypothetical protein